VLASVWLRLCIAEFVDWCASCWLHGVFPWRMGGTKSLILKKRLYVVASVAALLVRAVVTVFFNFYFALPVYFNMTTNNIIQFFSFARSFVGLSFGLVGLGAFVGEVVFWNTAQGVIDAYAAYVIGFLVQRRIPVAAK